MKIFSSLLFMLTCILTSKAQVLDWSFPLGGTHEDHVTSMAADVNGNVYVTGTFGDVIDFDPGAGTSFQNANGPNLNSFIAKYDSNKVLLWSNHLAAHISSIHVNTNGDIAITGHFKDSLDLDFTAASALINSRQNSSIASHLTLSGVDAFLATYDSNWNYNWGAALGGGGEEKGGEILFDETGGVWLTGITYSDTIDFDLSSGQVLIMNTYSGVGSYDEELFLVHYDGNGGYLNHQNFIGNSVGYFYDAPKITSDSNGNLFITGGVQDGSINGSGNGSTIYVNKFDSLGNQLWGFDLTNIFYNDQPYDIVSDASGDVYITGDYLIMPDIDPGPGIVGLPDLSWAFRQAFLIKYNGNGNLVWGHHLTRTTGFVVPPHPSRGYGLEVINDQILVTGFFTDSIDFDPGPGLAQFVSDNYFVEDAFLMQYDTLGNYIWGTTMGGTGYNSGIAVKANNWGHVYLSGDFKINQLIDLDISINYPAQDSTDILVMKLEICNGPGIVASTSSNSICAGDTVQLNGSGGTNYLWSTGDTNATVILTGLTTGSYDYWVQATDSNGCRNTETVNVEVWNCLGLPEQHSSNALKIYPNPTHSLLNLEFESIPINGQLLLTDPTGRIVYTKQLTEEHKTFQLSLNEFCNGTYFLTIRNKEGVFVKRVVKR
jgi:hypothetical protein